MENGASAFNLMSVQDNDGCCQFIDVLGEKMNILKASLGLLQRARHIKQPAKTVRVARRGKSSAKRDNFIAGEYIKHDIANCKNGARSGALARQGQHVAEIMLCLFLVIVRLSAAPWVRRCIGYAGVPLLSPYYAPTIPKRSLGLVQHNWIDYLPRFRRNATASDRRQHKEARDDPQWKRTRA